MRKQQIFREWSGRREGTVPVRFLRSITGGMTSGRIDAQNSAKAGFGTHLKGGTTTEMDSSVILRPFKHNRAEWG
jgi:hypothetical protein